MDRGFGARLGALSVAVAMLATLASAGSEAALGARGAVRHRGALVVRLPISTAEQLAQAGAVRVRIRVRRRVRVRLFALSQTTDPGRPGGAPGVVITSVRTVRLRPGRRRPLSLGLIAASRSALATCSRDRMLEVRAVIVGRRPRSHRTFSARGPLPSEFGRCRVAGGEGLSGVGLGLRPGVPTTPGSGVGALQGAGATQSGSTGQPNPEQGYGKCDPIDPLVCLQPWPNDYFTVPDASTDTGRRVNLDITSMPRNRANKPIDPADINRNDGFGPGSPIITKVPGMDTATAFAQTHPVPITDLAQSYDPSQPIVVINTRTLARQLIWTELDSNPKDPTNVNLIIHPAANLDENTRYIVALRNMRDASGGVLSPSDAFRAFRDRLPASDSAAEARRAHFEALFGTLAAAGIARQDLYLAWDFTVASERSLSERQLAIRNDAYAQLGDTNLTDLTAQGHAPAFHIDKVTNYTPVENPRIARHVEGTFTVPCYLNAPGCPTGSRFLYPPTSTHGPPTWIPGNTMTANFTCNIPHVALKNGAARPSLYGHGLFGSRDEVDQDQAQSMAQEHNFVYCATDWVGMACHDLPPTDPSSAEAAFTDFVLKQTLPNTPDCDVPTALADEADLSNFPTLVDRVDQAFVNFMYLGRLLIRPDGFSSNSAFQIGAGQGVIDTRRLFYDGNSQGGIFGGSLIALEPDLTRGVLGVPGMDYAVLLQRSSDFGTGQAPQPDPSHVGSFIPQYAYPLYQSYPNELERQLVLSLMQQMWDHSDPSGLAAHMTTDPLPNTPAHHVLMHAALGDHQVSNYMAEVEARTIGAHARLPWADPGRYTEGDPTYAIPPITSFPFDGSAIVLWDTGPLRTCGTSQCGTPPPPTTNTPPSQGADPHEAPRDAVAARTMKSDFLAIGGRVTDTCGPHPCYAGDWTGPP